VSTSPAQTLDLAWLAADPRLAAWRTTLGEMAEDLGPFYRRGAPGCC
jgi:hypothetical protein